MPALKNPKHERFCQEYAVDHKGGPAYVRAGYSKNGADQSAERLLRNAEVSARVKELDGAVAERLEITQESVLREIEATRIAAAAADQHSVALKAVALKGKHIGMWPNKAVDRIADSLEALLLQSYKPKEG
jgi:phage terminase small subunit